MNELTRDDINAFLDSQTVGRLGCIDNGVVYVVPLIFAREGEALYVMTTEGRKIRAIRAMPRVCFEADQYDAATGNWTSAIVWGRYEELEGDAKVSALNVLKNRYGTRRSESREQAKHAPQPERPFIAFRIVIDEATGRSVTRG